MFIKKSEYVNIMTTGNQLSHENDNLKKEIETLKHEIEGLKNESGEDMLKNFKALAVECKIDVHGTEYQTFMNRMFISIAGRSSPEAKAYSQMAFLKDNPEELLDRAAKLTKQASVITREIESKKGK